MRGHKHILKVETSQEGAVYTERSIDLFSLMMVILVTLLGVAIAIFVGLNYLIPLIESGEFYHG
jgi:NADH:ubiquinone oxidoreductase subunit 5 (subunit L)/multisubunit Na+/H+ antiporter MnhA subunit